jgi:glycosyltransferase involved in cell wall biosynthesis
MRAGGLLAALGAPVRAGRLGLLQAAVALGDTAPAGPPGAVLRAAWAEGISVVIPERGTPLLLQRALRHLRAALAGISEPWEIIVVVNGEPERSYADLRPRFPEVRWLHHQRALGFGGAVARGLAEARFGGVYLHNSDMALDDQALARLLPWRAPHVFAVASQIHFDDPNKRREETGWGDLRLREGRAELFDRMPEPDGRVRGGLYAGGGSSLFDAALLRRFAGRTRSYAPFYLEDVDWGLQAWHHGLEVLFHPGSVAWHRHRATISRCYAVGEIERIVARNGLLLELRNFRDARPALHGAAMADDATVRELAAPTSLAEIQQMRRAGRRAPFPDIDIERTSRRFYRRPAAQRGGPALLVVSPRGRFATPDDEALRAWRRLADRRDGGRLMLLGGDDAGEALAGSAALDAFDSVHLVGGRPAAGERLQAEFDRLLAVHRPDLVHVATTEPCALRLPAGLVLLDAARAAPPEVAAGAGRPPAAGLAAAFATASGRSAPS